MIKSASHLSLIALLTGGAILLFLISPNTRATPVEQTLALPDEDVPAPPTLGSFIEVMGGCNADHEGVCVTAHAGVGEEYPVVLRLRAGMVLKVASTTTPDAEGHEWHEIVFDEWIRYPGRIAEKFYVPAEQVRAFVSPENEEYEEGVTATTTKRIVVDRSDQKLYAYDGEEIVFWYPVSTGLSLTPTPRGQFVVYRKTPSRYMQGPLPGISNQYYDLPGVPWDLYFTKEGGTIHGAYWHDNFGTVWSHGCVNLSQEAARAVYAWTPVGTPVLVRD